MNLANDIDYCTGNVCPSAANCRRYTELTHGANVFAWYGDFWAHREAGADACDHIIPVRNMSTFKEMA